MKITKINTILMVLLLLCLTLNAFLTIKLLTIISNPKTNSLSSYNSTQIEPSSLNSSFENTIDNSEYEQLSEISIYIDAVLSNSSFFYPGKHSGAYKLEYNKNTDMLHFEYYTFGPDGNYKDHATADFSGDIFFEIKGMIFENQITTYEFKTDTNGKRIDSTEPYYITFDRNEVGINTPENIEQIIKRLEVLLQSAMDE